MDEDDSGVDKDDILKQIAGAIPMEEAPLPDLPPPEPLEEALAEPPAPPPQAAEAAPEEPPRSLSGPTLPIPGWWSRHRHEAAGLVTAVIALVWISLGIAARAWMPSLIGVSFALGAFFIGTQAVWVSD